MLKIRVMDKDGNEVFVEIEDDERQLCEKWSRVMGYHRPVEGWNTGKKQEFADRLYYKECPNDSEHSDQNSGC